MKSINFIRLREAIEASWAQDTAFQRVYEDGNPAQGNCYVTSRVVQHFFPEMEVVQGKVQSAEKLVGHFWNVLIKDGIEYHIDLTWKQFPQESIVTEYKFRDRHAFSDDQEAINRIEILLERVKKHLNL